MKTTRFSAAQICLFAVFVTAGRAQPAPTAAEAEVVRRRQSESQAQLLAAAEQAATALRATPNRADAAALRYTEACSRLLAALLADETPRADALALAEAVRRDMSQPTSARYTLARLLEMAGRKSQRFSDRAAALKEREASARRLLMEFPDSPGAHQEMLDVAMLQDSGKAVAQARQTLAANPVPTVKIRAEAILARAAADGQDLAASLAGVAGTADLLKRAKGKPAIFYTWRPESAKGIEQIKKALAALPADAVVIGVNLSRDIATARRVAGASALPGEQLYGGQGFDSPAVRKLGLTEPALLCVARRDGKVWVGPLAQAQSALSTLN